MNFTRKSDQWGFNQALNKNNSNFHFHSLQANDELHFESENRVKLENLFNWKLERGPKLTLEKRKIE